MEKTIIIIAEHSEGSIRSITYELIACARALQVKQPAMIKVVMIGDHIEAFADTITKRAGVDVMAVSTPGITAYNSEIYKSAIMDSLSTMIPSYLLMAHTSQGLDLAPALAVRLKAACITGVNGISERDNRTCFSRAVHNGKITITLSPETGATVLTLMPGIFKSDNLPDRPPGKIEYATFSEQSQNIQNIEIKTTVADRSRLKEAATVVAAGKGVDRLEDLKQIYAFSELFHNSAVAVSRPLVDMGWMEHGSQVGLTGATVAPELYMACGISGSSQHIAGMKNSKFIVAINSDPNAAIFNIADLCIVEEVLPFIQTLFQIAGQVH